MRAIHTHAYIRSVVGVSVCVSVTRVSHAKTAEPIEMPFERLTTVGPDGGTCQRHLADTTEHSARCGMRAFAIQELLYNKKHLKNVGPIRHNEPPHANSPGVATVLSHAACASTSTTTTTTTTMRDRGDRYGPMEWAQ